MTRATKQSVRWWRSGTAALACVLVLAGLAASSAHADQTLRLRSVTIPSAVPRGITVGPDGNIWFAGDNGGFYGWPQFRGGYIGRVDRHGHVRVFRTPMVDSGPENIIAGRDGGLWFTERDADEIGHITTAGRIRQFPVPVPDAQPRGITLGPGGNVYVSLFGANEVARMTPTGVFRVYSAGLTPGGQQLGIATGPKNTIWFTEPRGDRIVRLTPSGAIHGYAVSNASGPESIARGPDGAMYFTEDDGDRVGRVTQSGQVQEWPTTPGSNPEGISEGRDGAMWFPELDRQRIGRVTPGGVVTEYNLPRNSYPYEIVAGPNGRMWVTLGFAHKLVSFVPPLAPVVGHTVSWTSAGVPGGYKFLLQVSGIPSDGRLRLDCHGGGCNVHLSRQRISSINLSKALPRIIRPGTTIQLRLSAPGLTSLVKNFTATTTTLSAQDRCQAPLSTKLQRCPSGS